MKLASFADNSQSFVKYGDTDTFLHVQISDDGTFADLTQVTSIKVPVANDDGLLFTKTIDPKTLVNAGSGIVDINFTADDQNNMPPDDYYLEIWVVNPDGTIGIYPADENQLSFTITDNLTLITGDVVPAVAFDDFQNMFNTLQKQVQDSIANGLKGDPGEGLDIKGQVTSVSALPTTASEGDGYLVNEELYVWTNSAWKDCGPIQGPQGIQGIQGKTGTGISSTTIQYQISSSATTAPTGIWSNNIVATTTTNPYLWTKVTLNYTDGTTKDFYLVSQKGDKGDKGDTGTVDNAGLTTAQAFVNLQTQVDNSAVGTNLLTNSNFSSELNHWAVNSGTNADCKAVVTTDSDGDTCVHITGTGAYCGLWRRSVSFNQSQVATGSVLVKGTGELNLVGIDGSPASNFGTISTKSYSKIGSTMQAATGINIFCIYFNPVDGVLDVYIKLAKLELGSNPTDWCPNPSEILTDSSNYTTVTDLNNGLSTKVTDNKNGTISVNGTSITPANENVIGRIDGNYTDMNDIPMGWLYLNGWAFAPSSLANWGLPQDFYYVHCFKSGSFTIQTAYSMKNSTYVRTENGTAWMTWKKLADDSKVVHLSGANNFDTVPTYGTGNKPFAINDTGATTARPTGQAAGYQYFDTSLNKPIWYTGKNWVDATGTTV